MIERPRTLVRRPRPRKPTIQSPAVRDALRDTRPWVQFISIMMFICLGIACIGIFGLLLVSRGNIIGTTAMAIQMVCLAVYFFAALHLYRYSTGISSFLRTRSVRSLETALDAQKSFWKLVGIVTLVMVLFYIVTFMIAIASGMRIML